MRRRSARARAPAPSPPETDGDTRSPARRSHKFAAVLTALAVLVVGFVLVGLYPTRTWLRQERAVRGSQRDLSVLQQENQRLQGEIQRLQDPAEIERLARAEYNLVLPGEEAYAIIPGGTSTTTPALVTVIDPDGRVHQEPAPPTAPTTPTSAPGP
jgi:cell division protein FtsB